MTYARKPYMDKDHETNAAIYVGILGAVYAACTYIATEHDIAGGACFGLLGCLIVYAVGAVARGRLLT